MRFPRSAAELFADADVVVVGEIVDTEIQVERSRLNSGWGNYDWVIYCKLRVDAVEKGGISKKEIVIRCQRPKYIRSFHCFGCGYHFPIPEIGQQVRAHIQRRGQQYQALDPNGFTPLGSAPLIKSAAVSRLSPGKYTFLLPFETWIAFAILTFVIWAIARAIRQSIVKVVGKPDSVEPRSARFGTAWILAVVAFLAVGFAGQRWDRSFVGWMAVAAFITLIVCTLRPPRTALGRSWRWGINLVFFSAAIAAIAAVTQENTSLAAQAEVARSVPVNPPPALPNP